MNDRIKLAIYPRQAGQTRLIKVRVGGADIVYYVDLVPYGEQAQISLQRYTKDLSSRNERPFLLTKSRRQFKTLEAAVKALVKEA